MDISDEESEDGMITKAEQEDERLLSLHPSSSTERKKKEEAADSVCTVADLERCRVSRADIEKHCYKKWFQEYVTGAYVRYLIGNDGGGPVYRICEVHSGYLPTSPFILLDIPAQIWQQTWSSPIKSTTNL